MADSSETLTVYWHALLALSLVNKRASELSNESLLTTVNTQVRQEEPMGFFPPPRKQSEHIDCEVWGWLVQHESELNKNIT